MTDRHLIAPGSRIYCVGTVTRPCPAHAWWYHEGKPGRARMRCDVCRHIRRLERAAESESANPLPRCEACGLAGTRCSCPRQEAA